MQFTEAEKCAIANVLFNLANADFQSDKEEKKCFVECMKELGFNSIGFSPIPKNELPTLTYETLRRMTMEKKRVFSRMMTRLSRSDNHFGARERAFVMEILEMCEVPFVHR